MSENDNAGDKEAYARKGNGLSAGSTPAPSASRTVFVYANRLNPTRDAFFEVSRNRDSRREYIVDSQTVTSDDVNHDRVRLRMDRILSSLRQNEEAVVVLAGYSPLVAVLHDIAQETTLKEVFFIRDFQSGNLVEQSLVAS